MGQDSSPRRVKKPPEHCFLCPVASVGYSALHGMTVGEVISLDEFSLPLMLRMEYPSPEVHELLQDDGNMIKRKPNEVSFLLGGGALHAHPQTTSTPPWLLCWGATLTPGLRALSGLDLTPFPLKGEPSESVGGVDSPLWIHESWRWCNRPLHRNRFNLRALASWGWLGLLGEKTAWPNKPYLLLKQLLCA